MKLNIYNVQEISSKEDSSGDSHWRKITIKSGSLQAPETIEINCFWEKPFKTHESLDGTPLTTTQTIKA